MDLLHRHLTPMVTDTLGFSPVVVLEGARRAGKSTLTTMLNDEDNTVHTTMDDPLARQLAHDDPIGFLTQAGQGRLIIDEMQRAPQLILPLKYLVDQDPRSGRFLLTGSANLLRVPGSEDSLAGRALTLRLEPFSQGELARHRDDWVTAITSFKDLPDRGNRTELVSLVARGGYPSVQGLSETGRHRWLCDYTDRLIQRDATELGTLQVPVLQRLLSLVASAPGAELIRERLGEALSVSRSTVDRYLDILESLFLIRRLPAWSRNLTTRQIRRPKVFLTDSGLTAALLNLRENRLSSLHGSEHFGALLECFVANELLRQQSWTETPFELYHYRDRHGAEVDFVIETPAGVIAVEVKATTSPTPAHFKHLIALRERLGDEFLAGVVLGSEASAKAGDRLWALPVSSLWQLSTS